MRQCVYTDMLQYRFDLKRISTPLNQYPLLEEMLALRALGWSYTLLSDRYGVQKYTIRWISRKFGLAGNVQTITIRQRTTTNDRKPRYTEEKVNPGMMYADYLKAEKDRKWKQLTQGHLKHAKQSRSE